ncbi:hypothetical protein GTA08_BOTSDO10232 [Neofusicoccum parvum]|uniref:Uncharacterized protein n=1 Tax=Neofusicoccum parvum TaxID=310453 RepID=A0ACB5S2U6_9PEZI|nr:hypothetical protein GTA08_BOTSDO10232 [Neofusicoccum parvum]
MPSWPSTPHHTLPLSDLRKAVEEEVKGFLKRGLDLGIRRRSMSTAEKARQDPKPRQAKQKGDGGAEGLGDVGMEGTDEVQQGTSEEPAQQQQEQPANDRATTVSESGKEAAQHQPAVPADEPSLEGITLEIRALTGRGLVLITGEDEWRAVLAEVGRAVWMEGVLRVVVEVI